MKNSVAAIFAATACVAGKAASDDVPAPDFEMGNIPTVITPTRLRQSIMDVPASVSIITAEDIRRYGIRSIPEAFRLVPGMEVNEATGGQYKINYHGSNIRSPRRMNVLVDGISVYRPGFSEIFWSQLPIALQDIERIEVTRGPNSASYGPNSMMAVINIITKHPGDLERGSASATWGSNGLYQLHGQVARLFGSTAASLAVSSEGDHGYDWSSQREADHDSARTKRISFKSDTKLDESSSFQFQAAYVKGITEMPFTSEFESFPDIRIEDWYLGATWTKQVSPDHDFHLRFTHSNHEAKQEWTACFPRVTYLPELYALWRSNPNYANAVLAGQRPSGGSAQDDALALQAIAAVRRLGATALTPLCGTGNANRVEKRTDFEFQDTYVVSPSLRVVAGFGIREQTAESETYLGGKASNRLYRVLGNAEFKPTPGVSLNIGGYGENDDVVGWTFAPRAAMNIQMSSTQSLRAVISKGLRTPDVQEQRGNISYTLRANTPGPDGSLTPRFYQSASASGNLKPEEALSTELGYTYINQPRGVLVDARIFREKLTNLISETVEVTDFNLTNNNSVLLYGLDLQTTYEVSPTLHSFLNYTYLLNKGATVLLERSQYSRHAGALGMSKTFGNGWGLSAAYYGASGNGVGEASYGRLDFVASRNWRIGNNRLEASFVVSRLNNKSTSYLAREGSVYESRFDERMKVFGRLKVAF